MAFSLFLNYRYKLKIIFVGRCARAGRTGTAFSIISADEFAYVLDLHLFLGRSLNLVKKQDGNNEKDCKIGNVPSSLLEEEHCQLLCWHNDQIDLVCLSFVIF